MSNPFSFDYEFCFTDNELVNITVEDDNDLFDNVYNQCTIPDPSGTRRQVIFDKTLYFKKFLTDIGDLHSYSSYVKLDGYSYKICILNHTYI